MAEAAKNAQDASIWPVRLEGVVYKAGERRLLEGLDLTLAPGGVTVLMGPNGAGKSLSVRMIAGLIRPHEGQITFSGRPGPARKGAVALVFQRPVMLRRSVAANLDHALRIHGVKSPAEREARIEAMLEQGQLADMADRPARALSAGEQQRLAMVRALALAPDLLLMDEPTANLDPQSTAAVEDLVRTSRDAGVKCVLITHDRAQARRMADDIVFLHNGRVMEHTDAKTFFAKPASKAAQAYMAGELLV